MIMIVSWAIENKLVYFLEDSSWSVIVMISWAVRNNLVSLKPILVYDYDSILDYLE